jgi:hypothetical protein
MVPEGQSHKPVRITIADMRGSRVLQHNDTVTDKGEITLTLTQPLKSGSNLVFIDDGMNQIVKRLSVVR